MDRRDPYLAQASSMPALPEVARQLMQSFDRDDLALGPLAELIGRDPVIAAKVMRLANSARFSPSHEIDSLQDAVAALGLSTLRDLTLAAALVGRFPAPAGFDRLGFWRLGMATGCYAKQLALAVDAEPEVACLAGLMLRTGQVLMMLVNPSATTTVELHAKAVDSRIGYEMAYLGRSHPQITAELARHWQMPAKLSVAFHACVSPLEARPFCRLGAVLRLASVVAEAREAHTDALQALQDTQAALLSHLRLDLDWLATHLPEHAVATAGSELLH